MLKTSDCALKFSNKKEFANIDISRWDEKIGPIKVYFTFGKVLELKSKFQLMRPNNIRLDQ